MADAQLLKVRAQAAQEAMLAKKMEGSLIPTEDVRRTWSAHIAQVRNALLLMPARLAAKLASTDDVHQCSAILDGEVRRILSDFASA